MPEQARDAAVVQVGIRDYVESRIAELHAHLDEQMALVIAHERELRELAEADAGRALRIQAAEYERRLDALNGEHERQSQASATFLPRAEFDQYVKAEHEIAVEKDRANRQMTATWVAAVGLLLALLTLATKFLI